MDNDIIGNCPICGREMIKDVFVDQHHLIPKCKNGKYTEKITLHRICHTKIHSLWTEAELAAYYHTIDRIVEDSEMLKFIKWVKRRPCDFYVKTKRYNSHNR
jgi:hypothetical protein